MKRMKFLTLVITMAILLFSNAMVPVTADVGDTYTASNVIGKKITIDGVAEETEGWSKAALVTLGTHVYNPTKATSGKPAITDVGASTARISYDNNYLYVYYETTNAATLAAEDTASSTKNRESLYLYLFPAVGTPFGQESRSGKSLILRVALGGTLNGFTDSQNVTENKTYYWGIDQQTQTDAVVSQMRYGNGTKYPYASGNEFYDGTEVAVRVIKNPTTGKNEKKTVEIKYPLPSDYKDALKTEAGARFGFSVYEKCVIYTNGSVAETQEYAGYVIDENSVSWSGGTGYTLHLPSTNLLLDDTNAEPVLVGFQSKNCENGTYDVRFVSVVDDYPGFDLATSKLGYVFTMGNQSSEKYCSKVYETLQANETEIKASEFGGKYFFCFTIRGMDPDEVYRLNVKCFTKITEADSAKSCTNPVDVKISYDKTEKKAVFAYN